MADATPTESEAKPITVTPPSAPTIDNKRLFRKELAYAAAGVILAIGVLRAPPPPFLSSETKTQPTPITQPSLAEAEPKPQNDAAPKLKPFGDVKQMAEDALKEKNLVSMIVDDARLKIPEEDKEFWVKRMLGIMAIESNSRIHASSGIAFGLTQLRQETADEIAIEYKMPTPKLFNPVENLFFGLAHQLRLADRYGKDLSLWAHHLGSGNMDEIILAYIKPIVPYTDSIVEKGISSNAQLRRYLEHYGINTKTLLNSSKVKEKLIEIGANQDETDQYWLRYKQVLEAMQLQETKAQSLS